MIQTELEDAETLAGLIERLKAARRQGNTDESARLGEELVDLLYDLEGGDEEGED